MSLKDYHTHFGNQTNIQIWHVKSLFIRPQPNDEYPLHWVSISTNDRHYLSGETLCIHLLDRAAKDVMCTFPKFEPGSLYAPFS
jgi:hypothetical protein